MTEDTHFKFLSFSNESQANAAISDLKTMVEGNGWKFFVKNVIELNVRLLRKQLENDVELSADQNNAIKRDLRFLKNLAKLPEYQIKVLEGKTPELEGDDPYYQDVETLEKETGGKIVDVQAPPPKEKQEEKPKE